MSHKLGRPPDRNFDIQTISLQLKYGTFKKKIVQNHKGLSLFKLNEMIKEYKLLRKIKVTDEYLLFILSTFITSDKETWGYNFVNTVFTTNGIHVPKGQLQRVLKELDPDASEKRWALNISRIPQRYTAGPMHTWCVDAYCKVSFAGFTVYKIVDFASSVILNVLVMRNIRPESVFISYHEALTVSRGISPWFLRMDGGGETVYMKLHQKHRLGLDHIMVATSTRNVEVERCHRSSFEKVSWWIIKLLENLIEKGLFDVNNNIHLHSVWETIAPVYQDKLNYWRYITNNRKRRNQPNRNKPGGVPIEEFMSFFSTTVVGKQQYAAYKADRWTYVDTKFEDYAQTMKDFVNTHGDIPIEFPQDFNYDKLKYLPGTEIMGEMLTNEGIKIRNIVCGQFMSSLNGSSEEYVLTSRYIAHRITTEEILVLSGNLNDSFQQSEPKTFEVRTIIRNLLYSVLRVHE
eukprot:486501_1